MKWKRTLARILAALDIPRTDRREHVGPRRIRRAYVRVTLVDPASGATYSGPSDDPHLVELYRMGWQAAGTTAYTPDPAAADR